ncbi:hypothetical protein C5167_023331 [Papaver somniferum]|uniref:Uncharacterized protein n=1 Tax=Papaver somniferum TaxID=3469 RepID=A0A4Y7JNE5_PAPSO|nr:hypothetical protein C5167_023331 [Papaver somniferum]
MVIFGMQNLRPKSTFPQPSTFSILKLKMQLVPTCLGLRTVRSITWFNTLTLPLKSSLRGINEGCNPFWVLTTSSPGCGFFGNFELIQHGPPSSPY